MTTTSDNFKVSRMRQKFRLKSITSDTLHFIDKPSILIGRSSQCDISIDSGMLSRHHAAILTTAENCILLKDLDSTNGTFLNTMRVTTSAPLSHGDVITIGDEKFIFIDSEKENDQSTFSRDYMENPRSADDVTSNRTMVQSAAFKSLGLGDFLSAKAEAVDENSQLFVVKALGRKPLDANRTPAVLLIKTGRKRGNLIELKLPFGGDRQWLLGRSQLCDAVLDDPTVSSKHAVIRWENGCWEIQDQQSTNGVKVNAVKVTRTVFENGDVLSIGNLKLVFRVL